ncbi:T9SS type A sorting domain-containing protein [Hymenobacter sp. BT730]|uniref:RCC1 domain-containing protein n=1 Tax=Hymenobacter sp. BT730 TaxID=3063332 RepID=UPI0026E00687|nr:T9SS type A sorting domain-containing protein [Hymenobacter sp. BT730]
MAATAPAQAQFHSLLVQTDGSLWAWGNNEYGQLGDGTTSNRATPVRIATGIKWKSAEAGRFYTLAIRQDGSLWAWGNNEYGQLGDGTTSNRSSPVQIAPGTKWLSVSAGNAHTLAIRQDGTLWAWGSNSYGALGDGTTTARLTPVQIGTGITWQSASAGDYHSTAIRPDGTLWTWGNNTNGALGDGTKAHRFAPYKLGTGMLSVSAGNGYVVALDKTGTLWNWGESSPLLSVYPNLSPSEFQPATKWKSISAGYNHCLMIKADGTLWSAGYNTFGSLGIGTSPDSRPNAVAAGTTWQSVTAGFCLSMGIRQDGSVWTWGYNQTGALGTTTIKTTQITLPLPVAPKVAWKEYSGGSIYSAAIDEAGNLWGWGDAYHLSINRYNLYTAPAKIDSTHHWTKVYVGPQPISSYLLGIRQDGSLWTWGNTPGRYGKDSYNSKENTYSAVQVAPGATWHSVAVGPQCVWGIQQDGTLWGWGGNVGLFYTRPVLGDGTNNAQQEPVQIAAGFHWLQVSTSLVDYYGYPTESGYYTAAIRQDSTLWTWGYNLKGQLGMGDQAPRLAPEQVKPGSKWRSVSTGANHTVAIAQDGTLWAWGSNEYGKLGNGTTTDATKPIQIASSKTWKVASAGTFFTVAIDKDGKLWTWGYNADGALGNASNIDSTTPQMVAPDAKWQGVQAGMRHVLATRTDGTLWTWGANNYGQAGHSYYSSIPLRIGTLSLPLPVHGTAANADNALQLSAWPLPFGSAGAQVQLQAMQPGSATVSLLDATGRRLWQRTMYVRAAANTLLLPETGTLSAGIYLLRVQQGQQQATLRLIHE